ncbi:MAG: hypothetical protein IPG94_16740 [Kineosporiaceae bacterium]|nr:hypothetical protein [Kineosporiaceae bacterium]
MVSQASVASGSVNTTVPTVAAGSLDLSSDEGDGEVLGSGLGVSEATGDAVTAVVVPLDSVEVAEVPLLQPVITTRLVMITGQARRVRPIALFARTGPP